MLSIYFGVGQAIADQVKAIRWIDLDKGQLENPEMFHSIITPGVLIGTSDVEWKPTTQRNYIGDGTITVKIVFTLPHQTNLLNPLLSSGLEILGLADDVEAATFSVVGVKSLTNTRDYPVTGTTFYVVEHTFACLFKKGSGITYKTVNVHFNPVINYPQANA